MTTTPMNTIKPWEIRILRNNQRLIDLFLNNQGKTEKKVKK